eukprot:m.35314 g.35314  ORF g.35314 m.35314 type:complete len:61 (-) comp6596_c0_seq2:1642-1824(-)
MNLINNAQFSIFHIYLHNKNNVSRTKDNKLRELHKEKKKKKKKMVLKLDWYWPVAFYIST